VRDDRVVLQQVPVRQVRAVYTPETITVHQACPVPVALAAAKAGRFVPPFIRDRMTRLKPSFLWMMYRSQWAAPETEERVLAVEMTREGEQERSLELKPLPHRTLRVGLGVEVIDRYVQDWTVDITDVTHQARRIGDLVRRGDESRADQMLPQERPYPLPAPIAAALHISI
jgi:hypothetical protein